MKVGDSVKYKNIILNFIYLFKGKIATNSKKQDYLEKKIMGGSELVIREI